MNAMNEVQKHLKAVTKWCDKQDKGPTPWVTMLYGSQNYGLDSADSDVDTKTMVLPSLKMVLLDSKRVSTELTLEDGSLDNCKDVREMFMNYLKGNINFVETLFTPYYSYYKYPSYFEDLRAHRNLVANAQPRRLMHMAAGMAKQKYEAFEHPFEGKKLVLEKYGYDPKQLHHLVRLYHFMSTYLESLSFYHALNSAHPSHNPTVHDYLMGLKLQPYDYTYAKQLREEYMEKVDHLVTLADTQVPEDNGYEEAKKFLDNLAYELLRNHLQWEVSR